MLLRSGDRTAACARPRPRWPSSARPFRRLAPIRARRSAGPQCPQARQTAPLRPTVPSSGTPSSWSCTTKEMDLASRSISGRVQCSIARLLRQLEGAHERHAHAAGRIGAGHGARPEPGDYGGLTAVGQLGLRVEMADALEGFVAHPTPVVADVVRQPGRPRQGTRLAFRPLPTVMPIRSASGLTGGWFSELGRQARSAPC